MPRLNYCLIFCSFSKNPLRSLDKKFSAFFLSPDSTDNSWHGNVIRSTIKLKDLCHHMVGGNVCGTMWLVVRKRRENGLLRCKMLPVKYKQYCSAMESCFDSQEDESLLTKENDKQRHKNFSHNSSQQELSTLAFSLAI